MGRYLNPGNDAYHRAAEGDVFVDKTGMLRHLNAITETTDGYVCVTRPHGFAKTMSADMVCAYHGRDAGSRELFEGLEVSRSEPITVGFDR